MVWCNEQGWVDLGTGAHWLIDSPSNFKAVLHIVGQRMAAIAKEKGKVPLKIVTRLRVDLGYQPSCSLHVAYNGCFLDCEIHYACSEGGKLAFDSSHLGLKY